MTSRSICKRGGLLLLAVCLSWAPMRAAESIGGTGVNPMTQIDLGNSVTFAIVAKPDTDKLHWEISEKRVDGSARISSGYEIGPNERFAYWWDSDNQTMWIATQRVIEKMVLLEGTRKTTGGIYNTTAYENLPGIPEGFKKAIAELLAGK